MDKYYLDKYLENLFKIRDLATTFVTVLTGGVIGIFLMFGKINIIAYCSLIFLGGCLDWVFLNNLVNTHNKIEETLDKLEKGKLKWN